MIKKIIFTVLLFTAFTIISSIDHLAQIAKTPIVGSLSTAQLADSNTTYIASQYGIDLVNGFHFSGIAFILFLVGLGIIWKDQLKKIFVSPTAALLFLVFLIGAPTHSWAYYSKTDYTEVVEIQPNQTAFLIPETGANKTDQASFMSTDYLNANKVAMKRVTIPHVKLTGSGTLVDSYVPGARLLVVDRSPTTREWVSANNRGTSGKDESFRFESSESINIQTGIVISAFVKEEDAAKFVYWFGAKKQPEGEQETDEQRFASIVQARSLSEVVDDNIRRKVQSSLAKEFGKRTILDAAAQKADIIATVEKDVKDTFAPMGITISYVGYAESLSYDPKIQEAIDNVFIATKKAQAAQQLMASVPYEQAIVNINFINAEAEAIKTAAAKWNGAANLPAWIVIPNNLMESFGAWFKPTAAKQVTAPASKG